MATSVHINLGNCLIVARKSWNGRVLKIIEKGYLFP